ncbi:MAG TPA: translocase [Vicinamibacteria bacterium]|jgi:AAA family ATP:ADP antiporter|nr:translocase [Vicinamibacteria bacterium]
MAEAVAAPAPVPEAASAVDRLLRVFSDVRPGEGVTVLLLTLNLFLLMVGYYIFKVVREPLILALPGGAEMKSYAAAAQALTLMGFVPLYSWFSSRVDRMRLIVGMIVFFLVCIEAFYAGFHAGIPMLGFFFFVWVGIFSLANIAQFWSYTNDLYDRPTGERLFPIVAVGATAGSPLGALLTEPLFKAGIHSYTMFQITAAILLVQLWLYHVIERRQAGRRTQTAKAHEPLAGPGGFALLLRNPYLLLVAALLLLLNVVNTTGEYLVGRTVVEIAAGAGTAAGKEAVLGSFYGGYYFWTNVVALVLQAFVASRLVKYLGIGGVILALPLVALGTYGVVASGVALAVLRWAKIAENATDYSIMNTGRQMIWLPTSREEKYKAKQAADTFVVRSGDMLSGLAVFVGVTIFHATVREFAAMNLALIGVWLTIAVRLVRRYRSLAAQQG